MNSCENPNYIYYISYVIGIFINLIIINTLTTIEKRIDCVCANNSKKDFLKEWFIFILFFNTFFLIFFLLSNYECYEIYAKDYMNYVFAFFLIIIQIIMFIRLFIYINWLKNECKCSYHLQEQIIYWYLIIIFVIFSFSILMIIFMIIMLFFLINK